MRKIKKINGYLIVKFNDREKRLNEDTSLGEYGIIDAERYTGRLSVDRKAMAFDNAYTLDEAVELARSLEAEMDVNDEEPAYIVSTETNNCYTEKEINPQLLIDDWENTLKYQITSNSDMDVNTCDAVHELHGFKTALYQIGILNGDDVAVDSHHFESAHINSIEDARCLNLTSEKPSNFSSYSYQKAKNINDCNIQMQKYLNRQHENFVKSQDIPPGNKENIEAFMPVYEKAIHQRQKDKIQLYLNMMVTKIYQAIILCKGSEILDEQRLQLLESLLETYIQRNMGEELYRAHQSAISKIEGLFSFDDEK